MQQLGTVIKPTGLLFAALVLLAAPAAAAPPGEIAVICDQGVGPYRSLLESFRQASDTPVRVIAPAEAVREGFEQRLRAEGVRAVLAVGMQAREAVEGVTDLPVLLTMVPQAERWVAARANRSAIEMALSPRRHLETMRQVFPGAKRIGLLFDPGQTGDYVREARASAADLGLAVVGLEIARPGDLPRRLDELRGRADVIWILPDPTVLQAENLNLLLLTSFESRIPLYGFARKYAELGAVAATHLDPAALGAQAAALLQRLLSDPAAAAGRHEYARDAQLVLNQKVARKMGVVLGPEALEAADDVLR